MIVTQEVKMNLSGLLVGDNLVKSRKDTSSLDILEQQLLAKILELREAPVMKPLDTQFLRLQSSSIFRTGNKN